MDDRLLDEDAVSQICFVTDNLEDSLRWFSDLTGKVSTGGKLNIAAAVEAAKKTLPPPTVAQTRDWFLSA